MPSCLVVQHVEPEGPYAIAGALRTARVAVVCRRIHAGDVLPSNLDGFDGLVVMGGPMSATSDDAFPSRRHELDLLAEAVGRGVPVLATCLGAQLLAAATGGRVFRGTAGPEIGWGPVHLTEAGTHDALLGGLPTEFNVLHWHGDTYEPPATAVRLASSAAYAQQAFRVGDLAWGLQFHVEIDVAAVRAFTEAFGDQALAGGTTPEAIVSRAPAAIADLAPHRDAVLARFAALVASRPAATVSTM